MNLYFKNELKTHVSEKAMGIACFMYLSINIIFKYINIFNHCYYIYYTQTCLYLRSHR